MLDRQVQTIDRCYQRNTKSVEGTKFLNFHILEISTSPKYVRIHFPVVVLPAMGEAEATTSE